MRMCRGVLPFLCEVAATCRIQRKKGRVPDLIAAQPDLQNAAATSASCSRGICGAESRWWAMLSGWSARERPLHQIFPLTAPPLQSLNPPPGCSPINIQVGRSSAIIVAGQTAQGLGAGGVGSGNGVCGEGRVGSGHISKVMLQELVCNCRRVSLLVAPPTISPDLWTSTVFLQKSPSNTSAYLTDRRTLRVDSREHRMRDGLHRLRCLLLVPSLVELSSLCCIPPFRPLKSSTAPKILWDFSFVKKSPLFLPKTLQKRFFNLLFFQKWPFSSWVCYLCFFFCSG